MHAASRPKGKKRSVDPGQHMLNNQTRTCTVRNVAWIYPPELRDALWAFGLAPHAQAPPGLVRDALSDLYRYELRRMRERHRAGQIAKNDYIDRVIALRKRYWPLTLQPEAWERICKDEAG